MDAKEAFERGLVNRVVAVEGLLEEARELAARISRNPSFALKMVKHAIHAGSNMDIKSAMEYEARCVEILFSTKDLKEGIRAFCDKREPKFSGE
jgi:enoyl-CoA hydratase/carnithine racemase